MRHLEDAEWLVDRGRESDAASLLAQAREVFERLGATPWLRRLDAVQAGEQIPA